MGPLPAGFRSIRMVAAELDAMARFYGVTLGLPTTLEGSSLTVQAGGTTLVFEPAAQGRPGYHFAFNIPENQIEEARAWVQARTPVALPPGGGEAIYAFESWNAHAFYFLDPAGNLLEFIARHSLANASPAEFSARSILYASEIGWVVDDVAEALAGLENELGMTPYRPPFSDFAAVGDEHALVIVAQSGRVWLGSDGMRATSFPVEAKIAGSPPGTLIRPPVRIAVEP